MSDHSHNDRAQRRQPRLPLLECLLAPFRFILECYFRPLGTILAWATVIALFLSILPVSNFVPSSLLPTRLVMAAPTYIWCHTVGIGCRAPRATVNPLQDAVHKVKTTAATSLDIFDSFAHGMRIAQSQSISSVEYVVIPCQCCSESSAVFGLCPTRSPRYETSLLLQNLVLQ